MTQVPKPPLEHLSSGITVSDTVEVLTLSNSDSVVLDPRITVFEYRGALQRVIWPLSDGGVTFI